MKKGGKKVELVCETKYFQNLLTGWCRQVIVALFFKVFCIHPGVPIVHPHALWEKLLRYNLGRELYSIEREEDICGENRNCTHDTFNYI